MRYKLLKYLYSSEVAFKLYPWATLAIKNKEGIWIFESEEAYLEYVKKELNSDN